MGQQEIVRRHSVARHQQPAATALLHPVQVSAGGRLCDLVQEGMGIAEHGRLQGRTSFELAAEKIGVYPQGFAGNLDVSR
ncbi:hypothetical protein GALL_517210 [mine drainage metagenome]|uniref:Uncharacterized protein n=1 Tax=mine drainage metagenome TaxID=410659 RepID=A0A1J5P676_9ZZZZ